MDLQQLVLREQLLFSLHIELLTAADAIGSGGFGQNPGTLSARLRRKTAFQNGAEGFCLQRVARERGGALAIDHMVRGLTAAQLVVVHTGQIVVNE